MTPFQAVGVTAVGMVLLLIASGLGSPAAHLLAPASAPSARTSATASGSGLLAAASASLNSPAGASAGPWTNITARLSASPSSREGESLTYDPMINKVLLFGGYTGTRTAGDTWVYSPGHWVNLTPTLTVSPGPRQRGGLVYDSEDSEMLLFGGHNGSVYLNDTWAFNGTAWSRVHSTSAPSPREDLMLADEPLDHYVVLFGGDEADGLRVGDTWTFSGGQWTNITAANATSPPARESGVFTWDGADDYDLLFSGKIANSGLWNDTWSFANGVWTNLTSTVGEQPPKREAGSMVYDAIDGFVLLFGGLRYPNVYNDTWTFSGGKWSELPPTSSPSARDDDGLAYDPNNGIGYVVLFGGQSSPTDPTSTLGDTWTFKLPVRAIIHSTGATIDLGQSTGLAVSVSGGYPPYVLYQWFGLPAPCAPGNVTNFSCTPTVLGTFNITVNVTDSGGFNTTSGVFALHVNADPAVTANASVLSGMVPLTVNFTSNETGGTAPFTYLWLFGDGGNSSGTSPAHIFTVPGMYETTLTVTDNDSYTATASLSIDAEAPAVPLSATIGASPVTGIAPLPVQFNVAASGGEPSYSYAWTFGVLGATASTDDPTYTYESAGVFEVQVVVSDLTGSSVTKFTNISVSSPTPLSASSSASVRTGVAPLEVNFTGTAAGGLAPYQYAWTFGTAGTGSGSSEPFTFASAGVYQVVLTVTDASGDHAAAPPLTVTVLAPLVTSFVASAGVPYCDQGNGEVTVTVNASATGGIGADTYGWSFPNGVGSGANTTTTVGAGANWTIQLTAQDSDHHSATSSQSVSVPSIGCSTPAGGTTGHASLLILALILLVAIVIAVEVVLVLRRQKKAN
jgi:PKD repeat protein